MDQLLFLYIFLGLVAGVILDRLLLRKLFRTQEMQAKNKAKQALKEADAQAEIVKKNKLLEAKEKFIKLKAEHEKELSSKNQTFPKCENTLKQTEQSLNKKMK